jgi:hypothetical protein
MIMIAVASHSTEPRASQPHEQIGVILNADLSTGAEEALLTSNTGDSILSNGIIQFPNR